MAAYYSISTSSSVRASVYGTALVGFRDSGAAQPYSFILSGRLVLFARVTTTLSVYGFITMLYDGF